MRGAVEDKCRWTLAGRPVWVHSLQAFAASGCCAQYIVVYRDTEQRELFEQDAEGALDHLTFVQGGVERQDSVRAGLEATAEDVDGVMIHDCARPVLSPERVQELAQRLKRDAAVCLAHRPTDTIKRLPTTAQAPEEAVLLEDLARPSLWAMETPQCFHRELILRAYREIAEPITDDTAAVGKLGVPVALVENPLPNPKITTPEDLPYVEFLLSRPS
ncbi:MAG: 2-C-methyl-D-erythritol 4-phosphate cytidylyltransferase [Puniceicoccaceae bacterium 5H]|nr:MAG: 2-C-methyl-D-erythritol 4-phosphate cytidylyltransferase [Puniceicoccaceae bacterium 5H]